MKKRKRQIILIFILIVVFVLLTAYNFHINLKSAGDNFYINYPYLTHMAESYQITYVEAMTDAIKYGFLQTAFLFYCYLHILFSFHFIKDSSRKLRTFSIIINIFIGINCILLIPTYLWGNSIHGGLDSIGEAIVFGLVLMVLIYGSGLLSVIHTAVYIITKKVKRKEK